MVRLLLATHNLGKLTEMQHLLSGSFFEVISAKDAGISSDFDVEETGATFAENAELKARAFAAKSGEVTVADDSGLEVLALDGKPGVHSKRFVAGSNHDRNQKILELLKNIPDRRAKFVTVLCLFDPQTQKSTFFTGEVQGTIATEERGIAGFGYDAIFIPDGFQKTFGELGEKIKNEVSHRARAVAALRACL